MSVSRGNGSAKWVNKEGWRSLPVAEDVVGTASAAGGRLPVTETYE